MLRSFEDRLNEAAGIPRHIRVHPQHPSSDEINIIVVKLKDGAQSAPNWPTMSWNSFANSIKLNAIAIPPNTIAIDHKFISRLILSIFNDTAGLVMTLSETEKLDDAEKVMSLSSTRGAISTHLQLSNLRNDITTEEPDRSSDVLAPDIARIWSTLNGDAELFYFGIAPIIAHEIAHLEAGKLGSFDISDIDLRNWLIRAEEDRADSASLEIIQRQLSAYSEMPSLGLLAAQPLVSLSKLMRDIVLVNTFRDFRGLQSEDLFVTFSHKACSEVPEDATFRDLNRVVFGDMSDPPILTREEFTTLRGRFLGGDRRHSHSHNMARALKISYAASSGLNYRLWPAWQEHMLEAFEENLPEKLAPSGADEGTLDISTAMHLLAASQRVV